MGSVANAILNNTYGRPGCVIIAGIQGVTVNRFPSVRSNTTIESQLILGDRFGFTVPFLALYKPFADRCFGRRVRLAPSYSRTETNLLECTRPVTDEIIIRYARVFSSKADQLREHYMRQQTGQEVPKSSSQIRSVALQRKFQAGGHLKQLPVGQYDLTSITPDLPDGVDCCF